MRKSKEKVSLVFGPFVAVWGIIPLAPALLKSCLLQKEIESKTFDFNILFQSAFDESTRAELTTWMAIPDFKISSSSLNAYQQFVADAASKILEYTTDNVGISVFSQESQRFAEDLMYCIKLRSPETNILLGGNGVRIIQQQYHKSWGQLAIDSGLANCVVVGEGELQIASLIENNTQGLVYGEQLESIVLSDLPVPNFDDYDLNLYGERENLLIPVTSTKGCVRSCSFCDVASIWPKFKHRRGKNIANELIQLYTKYHVKNFWFTDSLINGGLKPFREMNTILADKLPNTIKYQGQFICRNEKEMPESDFELMRMGGCKQVYIGIESGSEQVRDHMKKMFTNADIDYTAEQLIRNNILQKWNIIVGYPTETDDDWEETLLLIKKYKKYNKLIKINPVGVFQLLQNTPITSRDMLLDLEISMHNTNGYNEWHWTSNRNPSNTFSSRADRWKQLVLMLENYNMIDVVNNNLKQKTQVIEKQLSYLKNNNAQKQYIPILKV